MKLCFRFIAFFILFLNHFSFAQKSTIGKNCYSEKPFVKEKVFIKMLHKPSFRGGQDSLINFLMSNINFKRIVTTLSQNEKVYNDTARVKFIVSIDGKVSDLTVTHAKNKLFSDEVMKTIKKSSCNWIPGGTERLFNVWLQFDVIYSIERRFNEVSSKIKVQEYDYATD